MCAFFKAWFSLKRLFSCDHSFRSFLSEYFSFLGWDLLEKFWCQHSSNCLKEFRSRSKINLDTNIKARGRMCTISHAPYKIAWYKRHEVKFGKGECVRFFLNGYDLENQKWFKNPQNTYLFEIILGVVAKYYIWC